MYKSKKVGNLLVAAMLRGGDEYKDFLLHIEEMESIGEGLIMVVIFEAGHITPGAKLRWQIAQLIKQLNAEIVIITDSVTLRGVVTALSWIASIDATVVNKIDDAVTILKTKGIKIEEMLKEIL